MTVLVEDAVEGDIIRIVEIADLLRLNEDAPQKNGFLISDFNKSNYAAFLKYAQQRPGQVRFLVAKDNNRVVGFLLAYNEDFIINLPPSEPQWKENGTEATILSVLAPVKFLFVTPQTNFYLIKQVAVDPSRNNSGNGKALYFEFLRNIKADYVFSAIVAIPHNPASEKFHRSFGFAPIMQCYSFSKKQEEQRRVPHINYVWLRPALPSIYQDKTETKLDMLSFSDVLFKNLEHAANLYRHEDNLNWTKLNAMIALLVGLTAISWLLIYDKISGANKIYYSGFASSVLAIFGIVVIISFAWSLQSGLFFMHSHKQIIRIIEAKIRLSRADYISPLLRVPSMSKSVIILSRAHYFAVGVWMLVCIALVCVHYLY